MGARFRTPVPVSEQSTSSSTGLPLLLPCPWLRRNPRLPGEVETVLPGSRCSGSAWPQHSQWPACTSTTYIGVPFPHTRAKGLQLDGSAHPPPLWEMSTSSCHWANLPQESQPSRAPFPYWPAPLQPQPHPDQLRQPHPDQLREPQPAVYSGQSTGLAWAGSSWARGTGLRSLHGRGTGAEMLGAEDVDQATWPVNLPHSSWVLLQNEAINISLHHEMASGWL